MGSMVWTEQQHKNAVQARGYILNLIKTYHEDQLGGSQEGSLKMKRRRKKMSSRILFSIVLWGGGLSYIHMDL